MSTYGWVYIVLFSGTVLFLSGHLIANIGNIDEENKPLSWSHVVTFWILVLIIFGYGFCIGGECTALNKEVNKHNNQQPLPASPSGH